MSTQTSEAQAAKGSATGDATAPGSNGAPRALRGLAAGLHKAQQSARAVEKSSKNDFQHYRYASSDDVIAEGRAAMNEGGCTLSLESSQVLILATGVAALRVVVRKEKDNKELTFESFILRCTFVLEHAESGESRPIVCDFPFQPEAGRPLDKALAAARTVALAYTYRDVLGLQRVPEGERGAEMDRRDDRPDPAPQRQDQAPTGWQGTSSQQAPAAAPPPFDTVAMLKQLEAAKTRAELTTIYNSIPRSRRKEFDSNFTERAKALGAAA